MKSRIKTEEMLKFSSDEENNNVINIEINMLRKYQQKLIKEKSRKEEISKIIDMNNVKN